MMNCGAGMEVVNLAGKEDVWDNLMRIRNVDVCRSIWRLGLEEKNNGNEGYKIEIDISYMHKVRKYNFII